MAIHIIPALFIALGAIDISHKLMFEDSENEVFMVEKSHKILHQFLTDVDVLNGLRRRLVVWKHRNSDVLQNINF